MFLLRLIIVGVITACLLWAAGLSVFALSTLRYPTQPQGTYDAAIVLTGGKSRVETGLSLLAANQTKRLFISGVHVDTSEADIRASYRGEAPLPSCCITLGRVATTTQENADEVQTWVAENAPETAALITSAYHMPRAMMAMRHLDMGATRLIPLAVPYEKDNAQSRDFWRILISEYHKTIFRWFQFNVFKG